MKRKEFLESVGATCRNWRWSWSFVNHSERFVVFGAWDIHTSGSLALLLAEDWEISSKGRKQAAYAESREHLRLVENEGYRLFTFDLEHSDELKDSAGVGPAKIRGFTPRLEERAPARVGGSFYASDGSPSARLPEEVELPESFIEGASTSISINSYERSARARAACLAHHGTICTVCGFDFYAAYGELGKDYIHVHHVVPLSEVGAKYSVNPVTDLVPVCPNCHAMIHRARPALTVEKLREHMTARGEGKRTA